MPNFATHCKTGAFAGALVGTLSALHEQKSNDHFDWKRLVHYMAMGALGGLLGSALPDFLEPAVHPNHRSFAHSTGTRWWHSNKVNRKLVAKPQGGKIAWAFTVLELLLHDQSLAANNQARLLLGDDRFMRINN